MEAPIPTVRRHLEKTGLAPGRLRPGRAQRGVRFGVDRGPEGVRVHRGSVQRPRRSGRARPPDRLERRPDRRHARPRARAVERASRPGHPVHGRRERAQPARRDPGAPREQWDPGRRSIERDRLASLASFATANSAGVLRPRPSANRASLGRARSVRRPWARSRGRLPPESRTREAPHRPPAPGASHWPNDRRTPSVLVTGAARGLYRSSRADRCTRGRVRYHRSASAPTSASAVRIGTRLPVDFDIFDPFCGDERQVEEQAGEQRPVERHRDLVLREVVRKDEVPTAPVEVDGDPEEPGRHREAFEVPSWHAPPPRARPPRGEGRPGASIRGSTAPHRRGWGTDARARQPHVRASTRPVAKFSRSAVPGARRPARPRSGRTRPVRSRDRATTGHLGDVVARPRGGRGLRMPRAREVPEEPFLLPPRERPRGHP